MARESAVLVFLGTEVVHIWFVIYFTPAFTAVCNDGRPHVCACVVCVCVCVCVVLCVVFVSCVVIPVISRQILGY